MVVCTSCRSLEAAVASAWNFRVRTSSGTTCSANGMIKCNPSPNTRFSTAPTYRTTPLCPASTTTTDSNIITIITTNIYSSVREIVEHQQYVFETLWNKSMSAEKRIRAQRGNHNALSN